MKLVGRFAIAAACGVSALSGVAGASTDDAALAVASAAQAPTTTMVPSGPTTTSTTTAPSTTSTTTITSTSPITLPTTTLPTTTTPTATTVPSGISAEAGAEQTADRLTPPQRTGVIISDSAMAGIRWNGALRGFQGFIADDRLESCRRLVSLSCRGREGYAPLSVFSEVSLLAEPDPTDVLVIATGYNDTHLAFSWQSRMILDAAQAKGFTTIAWVTYRVGGTYELPVGDEVTSNYQSMNDELAALVASGDYPELRVWDLDGYTKWAGSWFYDDGVHERRRGSFGVADWVSRHMAALDGRPCAVPWNLTIGQDQSCPNPDVLPFIRGYPDLSALYGI